MVIAKIVFQVQSLTQLHFVLEQTKFDYDFLMMKMLMISSFLVHYYYYYDLYYY